jgi:redox-sensing transcriptional repressor
MCNYIASGGNDTQGSKGRGGSSMNADKRVSMAVIKRLPRYYRYLSDLLKMGVTRISSKELSEKMGITASQIRQDLNCFGGFGQQGYGYNTENLFRELGKILGLGNQYKTIIIGWKTNYVIQRV